MKHFMQTMLFLTATLALGWVSYAMLEVVMGPEPLEGQIYAN